MFNMSTNGKHFPQMEKNNETKLLDLQLDMVYPLVHRQRNFDISSSATLSFSVQALKKNGNSETLEGFSQALWGPFSDKNQEKQAGKGKP